MASVMCFHSSFQEEDNFEKDNGNLACVYILVCERKILLSTLMSSVICVHF
jgi:hypothetical protein